jgi:hypothetical protein
MRRMLTLAVDTSVRRRREARITKTMTIKGRRAQCHQHMADEDTFFPDVT